MFFGYFDRPEEIGARYRAKRRLASKLSFAVVVVLFAVTVPLYAYYCWNSNIAWRSAAWQLFPLVWAFNLCLHSMALLTLVRGTFSKLAVKLTLAANAVMFALTNVAVYGSILLGQQPLHLALPWTIVAVAWAISLYFHYLSVVVFSNGFPGMRRRSSGVKVSDLFAKGLEREMQQEEALIATVPPRSR